ncbi:MAG: hypothetical protein M1308_09665 [Actinobacteria bacterium]|nr:hypothetical protein [Actinomycetota bacterium]
MSAGKKIRMKRIFDEKGVCIILPTCHHMTSKKVYKGQSDVCRTIELGIKGGATSILMGKGYNDRCVDFLKPQIGVLNYIPAFTAFSKINSIKAVTTITVEEAVSIGADGLVLPADFYHDENSAIAIERVANYVRECNKYGLVFVVESEFPTFYSTNEENIKKYGTEYLKIASRLCVELGVDVISTNYTGDKDSFGEIVDFVDIPVLINGGAEVEQIDFLKMIENVYKAGAKGTLVARNITEAPDPEKMTRAIGEIFRNGLSAEEASKILK